MAKSWLTRILLTFVIFTLGFGVGKEVGLRRGGAGAGTDTALAHVGDDKVIVFYMHGTFRCVTCNAIERMTKDVVETDFAAALAAGAIEWREVDFQEREDLAKRYDIAASSVVVVHIEDGVEMGFQRLDDVWTLADRPGTFRDYVAGAIRRYLP